MATQVLTYYSCDLISCASSYPADVVLCVNPDKLAANTGDYEYSTLDAILVNVTKACAGVPNKYEFSYDDDQILDGQTLLATDITGLFCKGCLTKYINDQIQRSA